MIAIKFNKLIIIPIKIFYFILFFILQDSPHQTNIKLIQISWLGLTTEINSNNGVPTKKTNYYTCTKNINWLSPNCQQHDLKDKF
jgi:hypothetical protein